MPSAAICDRCGVTEASLLLDFKNAIRNRPGRIIPVPLEANLREIEPPRLLGSTNPAEAYGMVGPKWTIRSPIYWRTCPRWHWLGYAIFAAVAWGLIPK